MLFTKGKKILNFGVPPQLISMTHNKISTHNFIMRVLFEVENGDKPFWK